MKYIYYPIVFFQESEEVNKITDMIDEGATGLDRAFSYMRQWEMGDEEGSDVILLRLATYLFMRYRDWETDRKSVV